MTQHESFPGRPRGRRARQDHDGTDRQGYDATPPGRREFPDLAPVRPSVARERDAHVPGQPGQPAQRGGYGGYPGGGQAPPSGGGADYRYQARQQVPSRPQEHRNQADETPSWAEPDSIEAFSARWHRRGIESRGEQRAGRRKRRRLLTAGGAAVALAIAVTIYLLSGGPGAANLGFGGFVTNFLPGELQQVPNPCTSVPQATLSQYLPGKTKQAAPPLNSGDFTECTWTLDNPPTYRVLQVQLRAYSPSGLASGNGSATFAAEDAFQSLENGFAKPGPKSGQAPATVTDLTGMPGGSDTSAFRATEVTKRGGATLDVANILVRYRNVIITVVVDGLNQSNGGKTYTTSMSDLTAAANTVAKQMASQIAK